MHLAQVHGRAFHRANARHHLQHFALPSLVAPQGGGALRHLKGVLHVRPSQASAHAQRQQARSLHARQARALQDTHGVARPGATASGEFPLQFYIPMRPHAAKLHHIVRFA
eukprot:6204763-Pleurochrysis_carterae.AAC.2